MASKWYGKGLLKVVDRTIDFASDTIKVMLVNASYSYNADHDFIDDVVANELSGTGYTGGFGGSGRKTTASKTILEDTANDRVEYDFADIVWTGINAGTIGGAIIVKEITNDASSPLIAFLDPADLVTNGGDVTLVVNAEGALQISYA
jgi:hypothetical protein